MTACDNAMWVLSLVSSPGPTLKDIEVELTHKEQEHEQSSNDVREVGDDTMTEYLMLRLEIEGQQYVLLLFLHKFCGFLRLWLILRPGVSLLPTYRPTDPPPPRSSQIL
jgi:hypothetical protein